MMKRHFAMLYPEQSVRDDEWVIRPIVAIRFVSLIGYESDDPNDAHFLGLVLGARIATGHGLETHAIVGVDPAKNTPDDQFVETRFDVPRPSRVVVAFGGCIPDDVFALGRFVPNILEHLGADVAVAQQNLTLTHLSHMSEYLTMLDAIATIAPSTLIVTRPETIVRTDDDNPHGSVRLWHATAQHMECAVCVVGAYKSAIIDKIYAGRKPPVEP